MPKLTKEDGSEEAKTEREMLYTLSFLNASLVLETGPDELNKEKPQAAGCNIIKG